MNVFSPYVKSDFRTAYEDEYRIRKWTVKNVSMETEMVLNSKVLWKKNNWELNGVLLR